MESTDTCLTLKDQERLWSRVKMESSARIPFSRRTVQKRPLSLLPLQSRLGPCPAGGEGPSLRPAVAHPSPSSTAAAVLAPSISAKAGGRMGTRRRGASCMCLAEVTGSCSPEGGGLGWGFGSWLLSKSWGVGGSAFSPWHLFFWEINSLFEKKKCD